MLCDHLRVSVCLCWCRRRQAIKAAAQHSWDAYVQHAWGMDELMPLSAKGKNSFGALGATICDSLDTLWCVHPGSSHVCPSAPLQLHVVAKHCDPLAISPCGALPTLCMKHAQCLPVLSMLTD